MKSPSSVFVRLFAGITVAALFLITSFVVIQFQPYRDPVESFNKHESEINNALHRTMKELAENKLPEDRDVSEDTKYFSVNSYVELEVKVTCNRTDKHLDDVGNPAYSIRCSSVMSTGRARLAIEKLIVHFSAFMTGCVVFFTFASIYEVDPFGRAERMDMFSRIFEETERKKQSALDSAFIKIKTQNGGGKCRSGIGYTSPDNSSTTSAHSRFVPNEPTTRHFNKGQDSAVLPSDNGIGMEFRGPMLKVRDRATVNPESLGQRTLDDIADYSVVESSIRRSKRRRLVVPPIERDSINVDSSRADITTRPSAAHRVSIRELKSVKSTVLRASQVVLATSTAVLLGGLIVAFMGAAVFYATTTENANDANVIDWKIRMIRFIRPSIALVFVESIAWFLLRHQVSLRSEYRSLMQVYMHRSDMVYIAQTANADSRDRIDELIRHMLKMGVFDIKIDQGVPNDSGSVERVSVAVLQSIASLSKDALKTIEKTGKSKSPDNDEDKSSKDDSKV